MSSKPGRNIVKPMDQSDNGKTAESNTASNANTSNNNPAHVINGIRIGNEPDSNKIVTVQASNGTTGEPEQLSYTNYKVPQLLLLIHLYNYKNTNDALGL